jgi:long-chain acyl-CoA synthetase
VAPDRTLTFEQLDQLSTRVALRLRSIGIEPGHRVTLWMENGWLWMAAYYGVLKCGAVINPCNGALTADEVAFIVGDCGSRAVIVGKQRMDELRGRVSVPLLTDFDESPATEWRPVSEIEASSTSTISYTSGTTGRPKGAALSHITIVGNTLMTALMHGRSQGDIVVSALPCTHVYGNIVMNSAVACGATLILFPRFDELAVLHSIEACRATMFEGVPTMFLRLLNCPEFNSFDLSSLRICTVGGQSMPVAKMQEAERRFRCPLIELWGMTELGGLAATHWHNGPRRLGSI